MHDFSDIIILALISIVLGIKLFTVLGQKRPKIDREQNQAQPQEAPSEQSANPEEQLSFTPLEQAAPEDKLKIFDPSFNQTTFSKNATSAYQMILDAYSKGDTQILSDLVNIEVLRDLAYKISTREDKKHNKIINLSQIYKSTLKEIRVNDYTAEIRMNFISEIVSYTIDKKGKCVEGHKSKVNKRKDEWVFSRDIRSTDPTWKLVEISPELS
jgi:predicted lipid-binding transport protein (Tim44 family)